MDRADIHSHFVGIGGRGRHPWGIGVGSAAQVDAAFRAGASWVVASHAGGLDSAAPSSVVGLLPFADANSEVLAMGDFVVDARIPAFAAVFASDHFRIMGRFLRDIQAAGFNAVQNFPSVGLADSKFRGLLVDAAMGYDLEVDMVRAARELGLFASAVVFDAAQAKAMIKAGADMLVFHPGLNADGEYREWNALTRRRYAEIVAAVPAERTDIVMARMAFACDADNGAAAGGPGVQFDRNMTGGTA